MPGEIRKPCDRGPLRFPATILDNSPLRSHILFKRSANVAGSWALARLIASSRHYNRVAANAPKSGRVHLFAIESIGKQAPPIRRLTAT